MGVSRLLVLTLTLTTALNMIRAEIDISEGLQPKEDSGASEPHMKCGGYVTFLRYEPLPISGIPLRGGFLIRLPIHTLSISLNPREEDQVLVDDTQTSDSDSTEEMIPEQIPGFSETIKSAFLERLLEYGRSFDSVNSQNPEVVNTMAELPALPAEWSEPAEETPEIMSSDEQNNDFHNSDFDSVTVDPSDEVFKAVEETPEVMSSDEQNYDFHNSDIDASTIDEAHLGDEFETDVDEEESDCFFWASSVLFLSFCSVFVLLGAFLRSKRSPKGTVTVVNIPEANAPLLQTYEEGYSKRETNGNEFDDSAAVPYAPPAVPKN